MKRAVVFIIIAVLMVISVVAQASPPLPASPTEWATDTAGFLSEPARQALNARLEAYERASGHQVLVWVGKTTGDASLEDWTAHAFQSWRVGRKRLDDGVVLFIFADDRKARIEVGYGLEGQVPDAVASRILRDTVVPRIQANDNNGAVTAGVDQLLATLGGSSATPKPAASPSKPLGWFQILLLVLAGIALILLAIRYPTQALYLIMMIANRGGGGMSGGAGRSGGGGKSGGAGASGKW